MQEITLQLCRFVEFGLKGSELHVPLCLLLQVRAALLCRRTLCSCSDLLGLSFMEFNSFVPLSFLLQGRAVLLFRRSHAGASSSSKHHHQQQQQQQPSRA
jgi:hypothetical protein